MMHYYKNYHWAETLLWVGIVITLGCLGYSVMYEPYYWSLTIVAVLLALFIILGYVKYSRLLMLKHKFVVVQETFTTLMLVYFSYYYYSDKKQMPDGNMLGSARQKFDDMYEKTRYHLTMPLMLTAIKTFGEIKNIKDIIKHEVTHFSSTDGFSLDNAKIITEEIANLFNKIKKLSEIISQGFSSQKTLNDILNNNVDATIREERRISRNNASSGIGKTVKQRKEKTKEILKSIPQKMTVAKKKK